MPSFQFENALQELQTLVTQMESGQLSLDDHLKLFERGVKLSAQCERALKSAEDRVAQLTQSKPATPAADEDWL